MHTCDVLLDMGEHGREVTLPQLAQWICRSQTISSISVGSQGGKKVDIDIITNLGEVRRQNLNPEPEVNLNHASPKPRICGLRWVKDLLI